MVAAQVDGGAPKRKDPPTHPMWIWDLPFPIRGWERRFSICGWERRWGRGGGWSGDGGGSTTPRSSADAAFRSVATELGLLGCDFREEARRGPKREEGKGRRAGRGGSTGRQHGSGPGRGRETCVRGVREKRIGFPCEGERREMVGGRAAALAYKITMAHRREKCAISIKNSNGASREKCAITMSRSGSKLGQT